MTRIFLIMMFHCFLYAQSKYPADTLLISKTNPILNKIGILPISLWQRLSYNTNMFNCQFFPSCSNYGAEAISKNGILKGCIMTSERITRCNPFAYGYHLESKNPFNDEDGRLIDLVKQNSSRSSNKSPLIAAILSAIIPGSGRAYSGRTMDGIMGFSTVILTGNIAYLSEEKTISRPVFFTTAAVVYLGEIYGAWRSAKYYQKVD